MELAASALARLRDDASMTTRVRILSVIDELGFGGDENRLLAFATTIDRARFDHELVTIREPHASRAESWAMHQHYRAAGISPSSLGEVPRPSRTMGRGLPHSVDATVRLVRKVTKLRRLIRQWRPDVIDAHLESASLVSVLAGATTGTPTVVTLYSAVPREAPPLWPVMGRLVVGIARVVVTDSDARRHDIIRQWMRPADPRVLVIPNGISPPATTRTRDEVRAMLGISCDPGVRVIGQVASLARHKGHMDLLEAARVVLARQSSTVFLLVGFPKGEPGYKDQVERKVRSLGHADRIRLVSYPGPIGDVWKAIDIQVHASTYDSLPNALIEGMSLAKPIVATTVGGVPDMLEHMRSALLVPPHDGRALASALLHVLDDAGLATRLGETAHRRYLERYQTGTMTRALEACFTELASPPRRGSRPLLEPQGSSR